MGASAPVTALFDRAMWAGFAAGRIDVQACGRCGRLRYPPAATCPFCLSFDWAWRDVAGETATILSWVILHRQYLDDFPPPYNVVAVRIAAGPILVTNLHGETPAGSWIGHSVTLRVVEHRGRAQHGAFLTPDMQQKD